MNKILCPGFIGIISMGGKTHLASILDECFAIFISDFMTLQANNIITFEASHVGFTANIIKMTWARTSSPPLDG